ncbi:MAG: murein transglycosylase [Rhodospirillales bacterium]
MTRIQRLIAIFAYAALGLWPGAAAGYGYQAVENPWSLCAKHTQQQERAQRIPHRLLNAISLAETGRWRAETREIIAWPWTVMAEGEGRFFETKEAAVAWVRHLKARGVENIDVGCMQVNLYYHGHQFASLEHAFDPDLNTAYAARFLREKFRDTRSWLMAAGHYHSTDGEKNKPYRDKVRRFWTGAPLRQTSHESETDFPRTARHDTAQHNPGIRLRHPPVEPIDRQRTEALNARFQHRTGIVTGTDASDTSLSAARQPGGAAGFAERRQAQLKYWRQSRTWRSDRVSLR